MSGADSSLLEANHVAEGKDRDEEKKTISGQTILAGADNKGFYTIFSRK